MLATTAALIPLRGYFIKDDKAAKSLKKIIRPHKMPLQVKALELKAFEDLPEDDGLNELLENPSTTLSKFEFYEATYTHLYSGGEAFWLKEKVELGVNAGKTISFLIMHPANVILKVSDTLPRRVVAYDYRVDGQVIYENIPVEDVIHIKYYNPQLTFSGSELRGLSPIKVLSRRLTQMDSNSDVQTAQMQNGGVETIVFDETLATEETKTVVDNRKDNFYRFLKNPANSGAPFFASGKMGALKLGSTLADMKVIESAGVGFKKLCNAFGTSDILFNNGEASTESNVQVMTARTYTNTTLPNVYRVRDALKKGLLPEFADKKRDIREDISEITELQPNSKEMAEWLALAWWVTPNEKREMMRFEKSDNPLFEQPLIPAGLQTLDELNAIPDIPVVTPNGL
jgi:HK97 family phage portal protein